MEYCIKAPENLQANIKLPASKSISNRVLMLNALCNKPQEIKNLSDCDDTGVMVKALAGGERNIDVKAAGTAMRFLTAYFASQDGKWTITGTERMKNRPIKLLVDALRAVGAEIDYAEKEGFPPLKIKGRALQGGDVSLDGSVSSQYISALLMAAPLMANGLRLHLAGEIISKPYIRLTIRLMRKFGVIVFDEEGTLTVPPQQYSEAAGFMVESDWSAASYWYEMMALCGNVGAEVSLSGLGKDSLQGDSAIVELFDRLGVQTVFNADGATLTKKRCKEASLEFDFMPMPDMAQTFAVTCAMLGVPFRFSGLQSLRIKETDRLAALQTELKKFGCTLRIKDNNSLEWDGAHCEAEPAPAVATYEDHRMAMAFAPIALRRAEGVRISNPEVVSKSYPHFWDDLKTAGFDIETLG